MPIPYDDVEYFDHRAAPAGHTARDMALVGRVDALESGGGGADLTAIQSQLDAQAAVDAAQEAVDVANKAVDDAQQLQIDAIDLTGKEDAGVAATLDAALQAQITANADLNTAQQAAITANIAAIAALQASIVKPDYEAAESDAAGILNKPDLTQSETYNVAKAAASGYVKGVSRILWNGYQYILNTDAALQAARGNTDTVDQTVLPSADAGMGGLDADWVRVATEEEIARDAAPHGPMWSLDRALDGVWPTLNTAATGSDGNNYVVSSDAVNVVGTAANDAAMQALVLTALHGDVITLDDTGIAYWFDSRTIDGGVANPNMNTWVSFGSGTIGTVVANTELDPVAVAPVGQVSSWTKPKAYNYNPSSYWTSYRAYEDKLRETVSVLDFGVSTDSDNNAQRFQQAVDSGAGTIFVPSGKYISGNFNLPSNVTLCGEKGSVIKLVDGAPLSVNLIGILGLTPDIADNRENITIKDITLEGRSAEEGFAEFRHLLLAQGVTDLKLENVKFVGFQGDGFVLRAGNTAHKNLNVTVRDCEFDGVNQANRNGISVTDVDGMLIDNCLFKDLTDSTMPGAIDIEPNVGDTFVTLRDITITNNRIDNCGGNLGAICVYVPNDSLTITNHHKDITIDNNHITNCFQGFFVGQVQETNPDASYPDCDVTISNNTVENVTRSFWVYGSKNVTVENNNFKSVSDEGRVGWGLPNHGTFNTKVRNNTFIECGELNGQPINIYQSDYAKFTGNDFHDCGLAAGGYGAIFGISSGVNNDILITENTVFNDSGKTTVALNVTAGSYNGLIDNNRFGSLGFVAYNGIRSMQGLYDSAGVEIRSSGWEVVVTNPSIGEYLVSHGFGSTLSVSANADPFNAGTPHVAEVEVNGLYSFTIRTRIAATGVLSPSGFGFSAF